MRNTRVIALVHRSCFRDAPVEVLRLVAPVGARDELGAPIEVDRLKDMTKKHKVSWTAEQKVS